MSMLKYSDKDKSKQNEVVDIPVCAPHQNLKVRDYMIFEGLANFEKNFPRICKDFLKKAKPDKYNGSYMDAVIDRVVGEAIQAVYIQRDDHRSGIIDLHSLHNADIKKTRDKLNEWRSNKEQNRKEYELYKKIYTKGTSLQED